MCGDSKCYTIEAEHDFDAYFEADNQFKSEDPDNYEKFEVEGIYEIYSDDEDDD